MSRFAGAVCKSCALQEPLARLAPRAETLPRMKNPWIYVCFFLSGLAGLVSEVVWSRLFVYTMGSSHLSIAVVVSVFMGGLALGSWFGGPLADRAVSPLRLYGWLVTGAGLFAGAVVPLLWLAEPILREAYRLHDGEPNHPIFTAIKAAVCAATILAPTTLMGATLPALARHLTHNMTEIGARLGTLYAVNTFGAVAGAAAAGFLLIGKIGLGWTAAIGAGVDTLIGLAVLFLTRGQRVLAARPSQTMQAAEPMAPAASAIPPHVKMAIVAFGIAGFVNMALQLGWTRALIISIGNSTYSFSVIVGIYIFGLAAGGWIAGLFSDRVKNPTAAFGWLLVATAVASAATIPWLGLSPARFAWKLAVLTKTAGIEKQTFTFLSFLAAGAGSVALVILPSTLLMGMAFPLAGRLRTLDAGGIGRAVGASYAANTVGAILGTAITGFFLVPILGSIWKLLYLMVGLGLLAGVAVLLVAPAERRLGRNLLLGTLAVLLAGAGYITRPYGVLDGPESSRRLWHPVVFALGAYKFFDHAREFNSQDAYIGDMMRIWDPIYYRDGEVASVAVLRHRVQGDTILNISGKVEASAGTKFTTDMQTQLLSGYLPLMLHSAPRRTLCLGLGGGVTLGAMASFPDVEAVDLLELSPEVVEAARQHFKGPNKAALDSARVRTVIGDGRNHLAHTLASYDVISSVPSNFWIAGLGNLFTAEFYGIVQDRLNTGGVVCQWIYGYNIRMEDYKTALRTILVSYPHSLVFTNNYGDTLLICGREPVVFDRERIARGLADPSVKRDLAPIGIVEPEDLFRYFQTEGKDLLVWVDAKGATNRDYFPVLEFSSPLGYFDANPDIPQALASASPPGLPSHLFRGFSKEEIATVARRQASGRLMTRFLRAVYSKQLEEAVEEYLAVVQDGDPWSIDCAQRQLCEPYSGGGERRGALLHKARASYDTPELTNADGFRPLEGRDPKMQLDASREAARRSPADRWEPHLFLCSLELNHKNFVEAAACMETAGKRGAPEHRLAYFEGLLRGMQGDLKTAEAFFRAALDKAPPGDRAQRQESAFNLGFSIEQQNRPEEAATFYRLSEGSEKEPLRAGIAIARCLRKSGKLDEALKEARRVIELGKRLGRRNGESWAELARVQAAGGKLAEAIEAMQAAVGILPGVYDRELAELRNRPASR